MKVGHRDAPMRHRTMGIGIGYRAEGLLRRRIGERMQQRYPALETGLDLVCTGGWECNLAQSFRHGMGVLLLRHRGEDPGERAGREEKASLLHGAPVSLPADALSIHRIHVTGKEPSAGNSPLRVSS